MKYRGEFKRRIFIMAIATSYAISIKAQSADTLSETIPVRGHTAKSLAELINKIADGDIRRDSRAPFSACRKSPQGRARFVIPDERTNSLIVLGNQACIDKIKALLKQLDEAAEPLDAGGVFVLRLRHGNADNMQRILSRLMEKRTATGK